MACRLVGAKPLSQTNAGILLIGPLGTNFSEILIKIHIFFIQENAFGSVVCEMSAILSRPQGIKYLHYIHIFHMRIFYYNNDILNHFYNSVSRTHFLHLTRIYIYIYIYMVSNGTLNVYNRFSVSAIAFSWVWTRGAQETSSDLLVTEEPYPKQILVSRHQHLTFATAACVLLRQSVGISWQFT